MGTIFAAVDVDRDLGVDRHDAGVASAMVNTRQQVGGSIGTALLNTLAATATADFLVANPRSLKRSACRRPGRLLTAYWWGAAFFATGAVMSALLFRRRGHGCRSLTLRPQNRAPNRIAH